MHPTMPVDPETAALERSIRTRQRIGLVVGAVLAVAIVVALLIWPREIRDGVVTGAQAVWQFLVMLFSGRFFGAGTG